MAFIYCDRCHLPVPKESLLIAWDEPSTGVVRHLEILHKVKCDNQELMASSGAAYGANWNVQEEIRRFARKHFTNNRCRTRLFNAFKILEGNT